MTKFRFRFRIDAARRLFGAAGMVAVCLQNGSASGGDWPQILGPNRNGEGVGERLAKKWPATGPPVVWEKKVGRGYAGVAVGGQTAILFHRLGDEEVVEALQAADGSRLWKASFPARFKNSYFPEQDGPLCVPLIHKDRVVLFGAGGDLYCLALEDGRRLWSHSLYEEHRSRSGVIDYGFFGAGSTPVIERDKVLVNVGGRKGAGVMAFALTDGKEVWRSTSEGASYSSPIVAQVEGKRQAIFVTRLSVVGIDPATGKVRYQFRFGKRGPTVNAATPLLIGNRLFVSASYGIGAVLREVEQEGTKVAWESDDVMSSQFTTCVHRDGYLYGVDGRSDGPASSLRCFELATGKILWKVEGFGVASLLLADNKLVILKEDGRLVLAQPSPKKYIELASSPVLKSTARALPALSAGRLYVRDQATLKCLDLGRSE